MIFGGLHTELTNVRALESWIERGGSTSNLISASWHNNTWNRQLLSQGVTSFTHLTCHEITTCALCILMDKVYKNY